MSRGITNDTRKGWYENPGSAAGLTAYCIEQALIAVSEDVRRDYLELGLRTARRWQRWAVCVTGYTAAHRSLREGEP